MSQACLILLVVSLIISCQIAQGANEPDLIEQALQLEKRGDIAGASSLYDKALKKNANDIVALIDRANLRFDNGDRKGALADIDRALKVNMIDFNALRTRADFKSESGNIKGALADYNTAIKWNSKDACSYTNRGIMRIGMGQTELALADFEQAIAIDNNLTARFNRIRLLPDQVAARADYEKLIKSVAKKEEDYLAISNAHEHFNFKEKAIAELDKALQSNPSYTAALYNRAVLRAESGNKQGALSDYNKYIELNGANPKVFFNRSLLRDKMNDREGSMNDLKRALELDPQLKMREGTNKPFELMLG